MNAQLQLYLTQSDKPTLLIHMLPKQRIVKVQQAYRTPDLTIFKGTDGEIYCDRLPRPDGARGIGQPAKISDALLRALTGLKVITTKLADSYRLAEKHQTGIREARWKADDLRRSFKQCGLSIPVTVERHLKKLERGA